MEVLLRVSPIIKFDTSRGRARTRRDLAPPHKSLARAFTVTMNLVT